MQATTPIVKSAPRALLVVFALLAGCTTGAGQVLTNEGFEIDCRGVPCDWVVVEGKVTFGPTWHDGDVGVDLSGSGKSVVEQKAVLLQLVTRQLDLEASVVRDPAVTLRFELEWYAPGSAPGKTFWERSPVFLDTRSYPITEEGVHRIHRTVLIPSESAAVIFRIVKEGNGRALVDELTLGASTSP
jgi:hypothetical protein